MGENLGVCADLTGGQVEMVDLMALSGSMGAMLANPTLATGLEVTVITGAGISINVDPPANSEGNACVAVCKPGTVTARTDLTFRLCSSAELLTTEDVHFAPVQLQLRYTMPNGDE